MWRGGRPFKSNDEHNQRRRNGPSSAADNDSYDQGGGKDRPTEFEDEEEYDASQPYAAIIQRLDLPLGTAVLHLSFPRLPQLSNPESYSLAPSLLRHKLVVALACADNSVRLVTLPLAPPSPSLVFGKKLRDDPSLSTAGRGTWGEELVTISGAHQSLPKGVAVAFAPHSVTRDEEEVGEDTMDDESVHSGYDVLLASHSADLSGMLLIHRIPVLGEGETIETSVGKTTLWRSRSLASPASSIDLYVSPSSSSSQTPRVLVAESSGPVRVYECCSPQAPDQGRWAITMYPPVSANMTPFATTLDARWVLAGRAVAALTPNGEWGIWDISLGNPSRKIPGSKPTPFTISGRIGSAIPNTASSKSTTQRPEPKSQLAPMTPSTRKIRQEALFGSNSTSVSNRGGISIQLHPSSSSALSAEGDESLTIWHDDNIAHLPSLRIHWQSKFKGAGGNMFAATSAAGQLRDVAPVTHSAEFRTAVSALPRTDESASSTVSTAGTAKKPDILVAAERSLTILAAPLAEKDRREESAPRLLPAQANALLQPRSSARALVRGEDNGGGEDQMLLDQGELDVGGLDRLLAGMGQRQQQPGGGAWSPTPTEGRSRGLGVR